MLQHQNPHPAAPAAGAETLTDSLGRVITLRQLTPGDTLDLIEAGGNASENSLWMRYAMTVATVAAIDGMPIPLPITKAQVRALACRIGNEGMTALTTQRQSSNAGKTAEDAAAERAAAEQALAKN